MFNFSVIRSVFVIITYILLISASGDHGACQRTEAWGSKKYEESGEAYQITRTYIRSRAGGGYMR